MLLSHKYKFIFIKTKKTAGTSIEIELSKIMSDDDIVTPIKPSFPDHKPRNYIYKGNKLFNHIMISDLKKIIPTNIYDSYYKFCVEREPVQKCISDYFMLKNSTYHNKDQLHLEWQDYLNNGVFPIDTKKYTDLDNKLSVDQILKYENLNEEMSALSKKLGFKLDKINARAKSGFRENLEVSFDQKKKIYNAFSSSNLFTGYSLS